MLSWEEKMNIKELKQKGYTIKGIVRETGYSRNTVRGILRGEYKEKQKRKKRKSILDAYKSYVKDKVEKTELSCNRIYEEIVKLGYKGSVYQVYRFAKECREEMDKRQKLTVRFETLPGKQAQVDWGYCGRIKDIDGRDKKLYVFVMILSYSRRMYMEFTLSMKREELIKCHINAFEYFGGIPESILYDNMSQILDKGGKWNLEFMDFVNHYGFISKRCRPYRARTKGKVERAIQYIKRGFLPGREFISLEDANAQGIDWLKNTADIRIHGTTGRRPCDMFKEEKLLELNKVRQYRFVKRVKRKAGFDGFVIYDRSRYSVPADVAGKRVTIEHDNHKIRILCNDMIVAEHIKSNRPHTTVSENVHLAEMWKLTLKESEVPEKVWDFRTQDVTVENHSLEIYEELAQ